jgi:hypothetical protein
MHFNFNVKDVTDCSDIGVFNNTDITISVYVQGELVYTYTDSGDTPIATPHNLPDGKILDSITDLTGGFFRFIFSNLEVWEEQYIRIVISKPGYATYDNTFKVFGYDLGNESGGTNNPPIDIKLAPDDIARAAFTHWVQPFTNTEYVYATTNAIGTYKYYNGDTDEFLFTGRNFIRCCKDTTPIYLVVQKFEVGCGCGGELELISECTSTTSEVTKYNLLPTFSFAVDCGGSCCEEAECYTELSTPEVIPDITLADIDQLYVDTELGYHPDYFTVGYELIDYSGTVIDSLEFEVDFNTFPSMADIKFPFTIPDKGDYLIKMTIFIDNVYVCTKTEEIKGCHYYTINKTGCREFEFLNYSQENLTVTIQQLNTDKVFEDVETIEIGQCDAYVYTFAADGVYNLIWTNESEEVVNLIVVVDCSLRDCLVKHIGRLACNEKSGCKCGGQCDTSCAGSPVDLYNFNAIMALGYGFYSLLNKEYLENYYYDILSPNDIERFYSIKQFLDRVAEYCSDCEDSSSSSNCGCGS